MVNFVKTTSRLVAMLEKIVARFLDNYLGDYIENLDAKKFKIDFWHGRIDSHVFHIISSVYILGDVVSENLYLKPDALVRLLISFLN